MGNTVAQIAFRNSGSHLGRFAVAAVFLLSFLVSGAWGACQTATCRVYVSWCSSYPGPCVDQVNSAYNTSCPNGIGNGYVSNSTCGSFSGKCASSLYNKHIDGSYSVGYIDICSSQCEVDSLSCLNSGGSWTNTGAETCGGKSCLNCTSEELTCIATGGTWVEDSSSPCGYSCSHCDAKCECEEAGGTWETSDGGYCVPVCQSQFCCDSLNQNLPSKIDTTWEGCVASDPANDRCVVLPTVSNNTGSTQAECTAKSRYRVCTSSYVWNRTAGQCAPISTNNCVNVDVANDPRCTKVLCEAYQYRSVSALQYNGSTQCYEGLQMVQDMMVCDNGIREERGRSTEAFQVCDSYLEANNISLQDYLSGQNGGTSVVGGNSAGSGGGNTSGPSVPCVGNGCSSNPYDGGTSVNAQGDTVQNSASPYLGNVWTPTQNVVTSYDSTTGITTVVQNSQGGDSVVTSVKPTGVRCLGVSGGVATLTNGYSTWTCSGVQSCSQAVISASINGGKCSASGNGVFADNYNSDKMPLIFDQNGNAVLTSETDNLERAMQALASVMNGIAHKDTLNRQKVNQQNRNHDDSLWKATFGNNLDAVRNMQDYIASASSANSQAIASAASEISSANSQAIRSATSNVNLAIGNAASDVVGAVGNVKNAVNSASSANSQAIASATSAVNAAVGNAASDVASSIDNFRSANSQALNSVASMYRDSVHRTNTNLIGIHNALDTGGIIQTDLNKINSSIGGVASSVDSAFRISMNEWYNDKLKVTMDSNATRIVDALDALQVEVQLDSIKIDMPKDSTVDSIHTAVRPNGNWNFDGTLSDSVNFGEVMQTVYDSTVGDTSFEMDSSFSEHMKQVASTTIDGSDVSDTEVDSVENTMSAKFDSSQARMNLRSDSAVAAYKDTVMKYYGGDSIGRALNDFFGGYSDACPRNCLNVTLNHQIMTGGQDMTIDFAHYICDLQIIGNYSILDFLKLILRVMTAYLCMILILSVVPLGKAGGKK